MTKKEKNLRVAITGGAGGLGKATALFLADKGMTVYALDINAEQLASFEHKRVIPKQVNILDVDSVKAVASEIEQEGRLDAVINFAGIMAMGSLVEESETVMQRLLEINLVGMYTINKYFFPLINASKGRIVNISSEIGWLSPQPFNGFYAASKYAVEAYTDSLRREMLFLGIKVIKINPGSFKTNMHTDAESSYNKMLERTTLYKDIIAKMRPLMQNELKHAKDPTILARKIHKALVARKPKLAYKVNTSKTLATLSFLPERLQDFLYKFVFTKLLRSKSVE